MLMTNPLSTPGVRDSEAYLAGLGERVRLLRSQRGMTRKALSQHAKVSERYLAQLEAGKGNGSIVLIPIRSLGVSCRALRPYALLCR